MFYKWFNVKTVIYVCTYMAVSVLLYIFWKTHIINLSILISMIVAFGSFIYLNILENFRRIDEKTKKLAKEGYRLFEEARIDEAISKFDEALSYKPSNYKVLMGIGHCLRIRCRWKKALRFYKEALKLKNSAQAHYYTGLCYLKNSDFSNAAKEFEKSLGQGDGIADTYLHLGDVHYKLGKDDEAKKYYLEFLFASCGEKGT